MASTQQPQRFGTLIVVLDKARNLPNRRRIGKQSCYGIVRLGNDCQRSPTDKRAGQVPSWNHEMRFTVPTEKENILKVSIFNEDSRTPDLIGDCAMDLTELYRKREFDSWVMLKYKDKPAGEVYVELTFYYEGPPRTKPKVRHEDGLPLQPATDARGNEMLPAQHIARPQSCAPERLQHDKVHDRRSMDYRRTEDLGRDLERLQIAPSRHSMDHWPRAETEHRRQSMPALAHPSPSLVDPRQAMQHHSSSPSARALRGPRAEGVRPYEPSNDDSYALPQSAPPTTSAHYVEPLLDPRHGTAADPRPQTISPRPQVSASDYPPRARAYEGEHAYAQQRRMPPQGDPRGRDGYRVPSPTRHGHHMSFSHNVHQQAYDREPYGDAAQGHYKAASMSTSHGNNAAAYGNGGRLSPSRSGLAREYSDERDREHGREWGERAQRIQDAPAPGDLRGQRSSLGGAAGGGGGISGGGYVQSPGAQSPRTGQRLDSYALTPAEYENRHRPLPKLPSDGPARPAKIPLGLTRDEYRLLYPDA